MTRKDVFPIPRIDDLLDQLSGKRVFSTLDAKNGYWQIQMDPKAHVWNRPFPSQIFVESSGKLARWSQSLCGGWADSEVC